MQTYSFVEDPNNAEATPGEGHHRTDSSESLAASQDTRRQGEAAANPLCQTIARALMSPEHIELIGRLSENLGSTDALLDDENRASTITHLLQEESQAWLEVNLADGEELSVCEPWLFYQLRCKVIWPISSYLHDACGCCLRS